MTPNDTRNEIVRHMALAFFACAWSDYDEQVGDGESSGCKVMDVMPPAVDPSAVVAAWRLAADMESRYGATLDVLLDRARANPSRYADRPCDAEHFGHYAAMQAMGHGVGLERVCERSIFPKMPYFEFSFYDLDPDHYPDTRARDENGNLIE